MRLVDYLLEPVFGARTVRAGHHHVRLRASTHFSGIDDLARRYTPPTSDDEQEPIFILAAGWRSGSTLLQRLIVSNRNHPVLIWGEPYDHCEIIQSLANTTDAFTDSWPPEQYYLSQRQNTDLSLEWIANLYPDLDDLWIAHRRFFERLFSEPAARQNYVTWGLKEVRLTTPHAKYLKWVFPHAKFLFIYRNPFDAYRSYVGMGKRWYYSWPKGPVFTPTAFGRVWKQLVVDFSEHHSQVAGMMIRYEHLVSGQFDFDALQLYLGYQLDKSVLRVREGGRRIIAKPWISRLEKLLLSRAVAPAAQRFGYAFTEDRRVAP